MTTILLVAFSFFFYQLLIKPVFSPKTIPSSNSYNSMPNNQNLMEMWRQLQQFQQQKSGGKKAAAASSNTEQRKDRYEVGEYIDYEEL